MRTEVVLRAPVKQTSVPGGLVMDVTGAGRTEQAIRAMVVPHVAELGRMPSYAAKTELIPGGVRLTVMARAADDAKTVARLRAVGFIGLLAKGGVTGRITWRWRRERPFRVTRISPRRRVRPGEPAGR